MSTPEKDNKQADTKVDQEETPPMRSEEPGESSSEEDSSESDLLGSGALGAAIGGFVGGAGGAGIGGMLGLTGGALREGGKKKRTSWY